MNKDFDKKDNEDFEKDKKDTQYFLEQRRILKRKKLRAKLERRIERQKRRKEWREKNWIPIKNYLGKWIDPNTLVSLLLISLMWRDLFRIQKEIQDQKEQMEFLAREMEAQKSRTISSNIRQVVKDNWVKIAVGAFTVSVPVAKHMFNHYKTNRQLTKTTEELNQTNRQLTKTTEELNQTSVKLEDAKQETVDLKQKSEEELKGLKKEHDAKISRLHVTLNRFNQAAMASAERETQMRDEISKCQAELAATIQERNQVAKDLDHYQRLSQQQRQKLSQNQVELRVLEDNIHQKELEQGRLLAELKKANEEKRFFSLKASKVQKKLRRADQERTELANQISNKEHTILQLETEKDKLKQRYQNQSQTQDSLKEKLEYLRNKNKKYSSSLQEAVKKTDRYALQMDQTKKKIALEMAEAEKKLQSVETKVTKQQEEIQKKQAEITKLEKTNQEFETQIGQTQKQLNKVIIESDQIQKELIEQKNHLEDLSGKQRDKLVKNIQTRERKLSAAQKEINRLTKTIDQSDKKLTQSYLREKELTDQMGQLELDLMDQETTYFTRLQEERKEQEKKYDSLLHESTSVVNNILNQQEADQKKSWWQKITVQLLPNFSYKGKGAEEKSSKDSNQKKHEKEYYFFHSWAPILEVPTPKVKEEFNPETEEWETVEPKTTLF